MKKIVWKCKRHFLLGTLLTLLLSAGTAPAVAQEHPDQTTASALLLIMDASGSMNADDGSGKKKIAAAKDALNELVDALPDKVQVGLRVYGHRTSNAAKDKAEGCRDTELIVPVAPLDRRAMKRAIMRFEARGWTPIGNSLKAAADDLPEAGERSVILVSDGLDTCAPPDPCDVARQIAKQGVGLKVHTIGFQIDAAARAQLECIAKETGGTYQDARDAAALANSLKQIATRAFRAFAAAGKEVKAGTSHRDAPLLEPGQYRDTILVGEELWYAVKLDVGQELLVKATLDRTTPKFGGGAMFEIQLFNPTLEKLCCNVGRGYEVNLRPRVVSIGARSGVIGPQSPDSQTREAGTYYLRVIWKDDEAAGRAEGPLEFSLELSGPAQPNEQSTATPQPSVSDG